MVNNTYNYLLSDLKDLKGVGIKTYNILKKKKINNIFDLLWRLPKSYTDRTKSSQIKDLKVGEIQPITIIPYKYNFPRIRNLPNRVLCKDETGFIDCIFSANSLFFLTSSARAFSVAVPITLYSSNLSP